jgi:hypothetical protein
MSVRMRIVAAAAALAALALSATTASACGTWGGWGGCGGWSGWGSGCGGCGYQSYYAPVTVYAPVQPTYWVNQGPVYEVPPPTVVGPVPEYIYPRGYGCGGCGYGGGGYFYGRGWYRRHAW